MPRLPRRYQLTAEGGTATLATRLSPTDLIEALIFDVGIDNRSGSEKSTVGDTCLGAAVACSTVLLAAHVLASAL